MELEGKYQPHHHIILWRDRKVLFGSILKLGTFGPRDVCALLRGMEWEFEECGIGRAHATCERVWF